jgi:SAM-dependent methyltransferase
MSTQEHWQLSGNAPEINEHYLVPAIFAPWAPLLIERAALKAGERVLDVACGSGVVARLAAQQVGTTGQVVGLGTNAAMLQVARTLPGGAGARVAWQEGTALALPYADATFDVVLCQLGLQYFPDRPQSLREMHRVLVSGGRVGLLVWGSLAESPGYARLSEALDHHIGEAAASNIRVPFVLGDVAQVQSLMVEAPFRDVDIRTCAGEVRFPSPDDFLRYQVAGSPLAGPVGQADDEARSALMSELRTALHPYAQQDGLAFPIQARLVSAHTWLWPDEGHKRSTRRRKYLCSMRRQTACPGYDCKRKRSSRGFCVRNCTQVVAGTGVANGAGGCTAPCSTSRMGPGICTDLLLHSLRRVHS